jgi:bacteriophage N4 adsorption protein B
MLDAVNLLASELLLFAACGFILFGIDDVLVDLIWLVKRPDRALVDTKNLDPIPGTIAIFVPAWDEAEVIGAMLARTNAAWRQEDYHLFVGVYANDPATLLAARPIDVNRQSICLLPQQGPTTKADCLNGVFGAALAHEEANNMRFLGFVLHDAEDAVDSEELGLFRRHLAFAEMIQIPVVPNLDPDSTMIAGHYADEFAEAHLKDLPVRQWLGASVPSAGTGTALSRNAILALACHKGGRPFDAECLTEDYEMGLTLGELGMRGRFVRQIGKTGELIAVRSNFPSTLRTSVRQKSRWIAGIAFAGWDRIGWRGNLAEHWMRWRDRRSFIAAITIISSYLAIALNSILFFFGAQIAVSPALKNVLYFGLATLAWRLVFRTYATTYTYGWKEGLRAAPRLLISNGVAILASFRALSRYTRILMTGKIEWEKTEHCLHSTVPK